MPAASHFRDLETIRDADGACATITVHDQRGSTTFRLFREFERDGATQATSFFARRHIAGLRRLLSDLEDRLDEHEDRERARRRPAP